MEKRARSASIPHIKTENLSIERQVDAIVEKRKQMFQRNSEKIVKENPFDSTAAQMSSG